MSSDPLPVLVRSGPRAYAWLVFLYPQVLRARFRDEMSHVFEQQLHAAWQARGYGGVLCSWWTAIGELIHIALPARLEPLKIPAISILLSFLFIALALATIAPSCRPK